MPFSIHRPSVGHPYFRLLFLVVNGSTLHTSVLQNFSETTIIRRKNTSNITQEGSNQCPEESAPDLLNLTAPDFQTDEKKSSSKKKGKSPSAKNKPKHQGCKGGKLPGEFRQSGSGVLLCLCKTSNLCNAL